MTIGEGEVVGLLGPSGSGKTTLIRCILGLPIPNAIIRCVGLQVAGRDLLTMSSRERHRLRRQQMGIVFQDPASRLSPFRTIERQIADAIPSGRAGVDNAERLREFGFTDPGRIADSYPHQLSGGECQRVAIAQALAADPALLLADEPTSSLDTVNQQQILHLLLSLRQKRKVAMLCISHDPLLLRALADRIVRLQDGTVTPFQNSRSHYFPVGRTLPKTLPETQSQLAIRDLRLSYASSASWLRRGKKSQLHWALQGVSLQVEPGECFAVVGASGSGKSTLAHCIAGLLHPQTGTMEFSGKPLAGPRSKQTCARIQLILQNTATALNPQLSVRQILEEPLQIHSPRRLHHAVDEVLAALEAVSLPAEYRLRRPSQLSGGERQRVAIARALMSGPTLLLLDEALSGLDRDRQESILGLLESLRMSRGLACLHFSHDLGQMLRVADHIAVMESGSIVETHPASMFPRMARHPASLRLLEAMLLEEAS